MLQANLDIAADFDATLNTAREQLALGRLFLLRLAETQSLLDYLVGDVTSRPCQRPLGSTSITVTIDTWPNSTSSDDTGATGMSLTNMQSRLMSSC